MALTLALLPLVVAGLRDRIAAIRGWQEPKPIAFSYIEALDPSVAAHIGLRQTSQALADEQAGLESLERIAAAIGSFLKHKAQVRLWAANAVSGPPIERLAWQP